MLFFKNESMNKVELFIITSYKFLLTWILVALSEGRYGGYPRLLVSAPDCWAHDPEVDTQSAHERLCGRFGLRTQVQICTSVEENDFIVSLKPVCENAINASQSKNTQHVNCLCNDFWALFLLCGAVCLTCGCYWIMQCVCALLKGSVRWINKWCWSDEAHFQHNSIQQLVYWLRHC